MLVLKPFNILSCLEDILYIFDRSVYRAANLKIYFHALNVVTFTIKVISYDRRVAILTGGGGCTIIGCQAIDHLSLTACRHPVSQSRDYQ